MRGRDLAFALVAVARCSDEGASFELASATLELLDGWRRKLARAWDSLMRQPLIDVAECNYPQSNILPPAPDSHLHQGPGCGVGGVSGPHVNYVVHSWLVNYVMDITSAPLRLPALRLDGDLMHPPLRYDGVAQSL
ncbi:hypothetical protein HaLaN_11396, partial [Haematococcus lacustris]